jgi:hypothetical protein
MKTITETFNSYSLLRYQGLKQHQLDFIKKYLEVNENKERNQFYFETNRIFMDNKPVIIEGIIYEYETVFPKKKNIGTAIELMLSVFDKYERDNL